MSEISFMFVSFLMGVVFTIAVGGPAFTHVAYGPESLNHKASTVIQECEANLPRYQFCELTAIPGEESEK